MSYTIDLGPVFAPWKDFGTVLKGELKRTVVSLNTSLQLILGPTLARNEYATLMNKHKEKIGKIDKEVNTALDKLPAGVMANTAMWVMAPHAMLFMGARETAGKVTPATVDNFMKEYGFKDLSIGPIPIGKWATGLAKAGASAGGFATLSNNAFDKTEKEKKEDERAKWYTPIEKILLLQNPLGKKVTRESAKNKYSLLLENKKSDEEVALASLTRMSGAEKKYNSEVGIPYLESKDALITGLVDIFEKEIEETANISGSATFEDFLEALKSSTLEKFKKFNSQNIKKDMESEIDSLIEDEEKLNKFLEVAGKEISDFNDDEQKIRKFLVEKIYEKEFSELRMKSIESIVNGVEEIKVEILDGIDEKNLDDLKVNTLGEQYHSIIKSALERLDKAQQAIMNIQKDAEKAIN